MVFSDFGLVLMQGTTDRSISRFKVMQYLIIIEEATTGYSAYSPDLPGCVSTGKTREELEQNMRAAIAFHLEGLKLEGYEIPQLSAYIEVIAL